MRDTTETLRNSHIWSILPTVCAAWILGDLLVLRQPEVSQNHGISWVGRHPSGSLSPASGPAQDIPSIPPCLSALSIRKRLGKGLGFLLASFWSFTVNCWFLIQETWPGTRMEIQQSGGTSSHLWGRSGSTSAGAFSCWSSVSGHADTAQSRKEQCCCQ